MDPASWDIAPATDRSKAAMVQKIFFINNLFKAVPKLQLLEQLPWI
jgi:hypothetical protein